MNHWYTADQLAAGRRGDFEREASGTVRIRVSRLEAGGSVANDAGRKGGAVIIGRNPLTALRSALVVILDFGRDATVRIEHGRADPTHGR